MSIIITPLTIEVALELAAVHLPHGDLADHFLVAAARVFGLTLVTADKHLIQEAGIKVIAKELAG